MGRFKDTRVSRNPSGGQIETAESGCEFAPWLSAALFLTSSEPELGIGYWLALKSQAKKKQQMTGYLSRGTMEKDLREERAGDGIQGQTCKVSAHVSSCCLLQGTDGRGAGWERLHLGKTGGSCRPAPCTIRQDLTDSVSPLPWRGPGVLSSPGQQHQSLSWSAVLHVRGHGGSAQEPCRPRLPGALPALGTGRAGARTAFVCQHTRAGEEASRGDKSRMAKQRAGVSRA